LSGKFSHEVMFEMMLNVKSATMGDNELESLKRLASRYLKKN
jgi:hypothetical protein